MFLSLIDVIQKMGLYPTYLSLLANFVAVSTCEYEGDSQESDEAGELNIEGDTS